MNNSVQPIVLAAGKGTRMGNPDLPKVLVELNGKPMISYLLDTLAKTSFEAPALVVGYLQEKVKDALGDAYTYVTQEEQLGTGHAVAVCEEALKGKSDILLVCCGDNPLITDATFNKLVSTHQEAGAVLTMATFTSQEESFKNFGRIIRNEAGEVIANKENKDASEEEKTITEYNPGIYCFSDAWLWGALKNLNTSNAQGEYYLTDLLAMAVNEGQTVATIALERWQEALGINTPEQLKQAEEYV